VVSHYVVIVCVIACHNTSYWDNEGRGAERGWLPGFGGVPGRWQAEARHAGAAVDSGRTGLEPSYARECGATMPDEGELLAGLRRQDRIQQRRFVERYF